MSCLRSFLFAGYYLYQQSSVTDGVGNTEDALISLEDVEKENKVESGLHRET